MGGLNTSYWNLVMLTDRAIGHLNRAYGVPGQELEQNLAMLADSLW